jgi:hypothetical protein
MRPENRNFRIPRASGFSCLSRANSVARRARGRVTAHRVVVLHRSKDVSSQLSD